MCCVVESQTLKRARRERERIVIISSIRRRKEKKEERIFRGAPKEQKERERGVDITVYFVRSLRVFFYKLFTSLVCVCVTKKSVGHRKENIFCRFTVCLFLFALVWVLFVLFLWSVAVIFFHYLCNRVTGKKTKKKKHLFFLFFCGPKELAKTECVCVCAKRKKKDTSWVLTVCACVFFFVERSINYTYQTVCVEDLEREKRERERTKKTEWCDVMFFLFFFFFRLLIVL